MSVQSDGRKNPILEVILRCSQCCTSTVAGSWEMISQPLWERAWGLQLSLTPSREPGPVPGGAAPKLLRGAGLAGPLSSQGHPTCKLFILCRKCGQMA